MNKNLAITLLTVGIAALIGVLVWGITTGGRAFWGGGWYIGTIGPADAGATVSEAESPASDIRAITLSFASEDIVVRKGSGDKVKIEQVSREDLPQEYKMRVRVDGSQLIAQCGTYADSFHMVNTPYSRIEVTVPQKLAGELNVSTASGTIRVENTEANNIDIETASGDVDLMGMRLDDEIRVSTASGDVRGERFSCRALDVDTASGSVRIDGEADQDVSCSTASGDVFVSGSAKSVSCNTASGNVGCKAAKLDTFQAETASGSIVLEVSNAATLRDVSLDTMSGDMRVALPAGTQVDVDFSSMSGQMRTDTSGGGLVLADGGIRIEAGSASGDLTLTTSGSSPAPDVETAS